MTIVPARLVLASASPRRLALLQQAMVVADDVIPADIDETPRKTETPMVYARRIAAEKASTIRTNHPSAHQSFILSADTVVACGRRILPKAESRAQAVECLKLLSGRRHRVLTAVSVITPAGKQKTKVVTSTIAFKRLTPQDIDFYIATNEWDGKAGGYAIQGYAARFISFISGSYTGIVGLPLFETMNLLEGLGFRKGVS